MNDLIVMSLPTAQVFWGICVLFAFPAMTALITVALHKFFTG